MLYDIILFLDLLWYSIVTYDHVTVCEIILNPNPKSINKKNKKEKVYYF